MTSEHKLVRISAQSKSLPDGWHLDVEPGRCLDWAKSLVENLSRVEPVLAISLSCGSESWAWKGAIS